jgi:RND family efflux transporter MFP subunit
LFAEESEIMRTNLVERPEVEPLDVAALSDEPTVEKTPRKPKPAVKRPSPHKRRWLLLVAAAVVAVGGWYFHAQWAGGGKSQAVPEATGGASDSTAGKATLGFVSDGGAAARGGKNATARLQVVPVEVVQSSDILRLTGTLIADERSSVASNTSGIAAEVRVDRGSLVRKNDVLVQIDPTDAKNKLTEGLAMLNELKARLGLEGDLTHFNPEEQPEVRLAKASADLAELNLKRAKEMYGKKVISTEAYDQTRTEYELATQRYRQSLLLIKQAYQVCKTAEAKLAILEKAVADTTIRAPFDGWVAEKLVAVGEQISSGMQATKVVTLVRIDPLRLSLVVPQQNIGCIQPGQAVRFYVDSFPDRTFNATVRYIAPVVTNDTRSMFVEALVPNPNGELRPGLFATAELVLPNKGAQVFVPKGAVQRIGEVARVFVVRDGVAREQVVALGKTDKERIEIASGLTGQERIVAQPELVHDGDPVRP